MMKSKQKIHKNNDLRLTFLANNNNLMYSNGEIRQANEKYLLVFQFRQLYYFTTALLLLGKPGRNEC